MQLARKQQEEGPAKLLEGPVLICGWRPGIAILLRTLDTVLKFGAEVCCYLMSRRSGLPDERIRCACS